MYFVCFIIFIMAGFRFDDNDFSLSGLTQEGHDVTVISSSSDDDDNYGGMLECAQKLAGEISDETSMEGGVKAGVETGVETGVEPGDSKMPISKMANTALILSNDMASSLSHSQQSIDVSFINFNAF